jgi:hypothetical protein
MKAQGIKKESNRIKAPTKKKVAIADFGGMAANQPKASPTGQTDYVRQRAIHPAGGSQANYGDPSAGRRRSQDTDTVGPRKWKGSEYPPPKKTSTDALGAFKTLKKRALVAAQPTPIQQAKKTAADRAGDILASNIASAEEAGGVGGARPEEAHAEKIASVRGEKADKPLTPQSESKEWTSYEGDQKLFEGWRRFTKE